MASSTHVFSPNYYLIDVTRRPAVGICCRYEQSTPVLINAIACANTASRSAHSHGFCVFIIAHSSRLWRRNRNRRPLPLTEKLLCHLSPHWSAAGRGNLIRIKFSGCQGPQIGLALAGIAGRPQPLPGLCSRHKNAAPAAFMARLPVAGISDLSSAPCPDTVICFTSR